MIPKLARLLLLKSVRGWVKYGGQISYPLQCDNQWNFDKLVTCPGCPGILYRQTPTTLSAGKKTVYKMDLNRNIFSSTTGGKWRVKTDRRRQEWSVCIGKARVSWAKPPPPLWQRFEWMEMCRWHNSSAFSRLSLVLSVSSVVTGRKSETLHRTVSLPEGCVCGCVKTL